MTTKSMIRVYPLSLLLRWWVLISAEPAASGGREGGRWWISPTLINAGSELYIQVEKHEV